jgi:hypothetical protein
MDWLTPLVRRQFALIVAAMVLLTALVTVQSSNGAQAQRSPVIESFVQLGLYLAYYDQINRIAVAQNQMSAADADARLRSKAKELYGRTITQADFNQLIEQHRRAANAYFSRVEQEVNAATRWPRGVSPESGREAGKSLVQKARREYESAVAARHDPLSGLMGATVVRGFAMGSESPPESINVFGDQWQRITDAMPSDISRDVMGKLVNATQLAAAQTVSQTAGERPIPGEMGRPSAGERPIPGEMGRPSSGERPIPGEMGAPTSGSRPIPGGMDSYARRRIGPVPGERARSGSPASSGVAPQPTDLASRAQIGPVPGERRRVTSVASPPVGSGTPVVPVETGSPPPPPSTPASGVSPPSAGRAISPPQPGEDEHTFWGRVYAANTREAYELYLRQYPNGVYADIARAAMSIQTPPVAPTPTTQPAP